MLRDGAVAVEAEWTDTSKQDVDYREIDRQLRRIAKRRAALDSEEARWLREAEAKQVWRKLGFATALEYLEDVFGYAPRTALERLRVAKELGQLPQLDAELRDGEINYGVARELSRVMTPRTEAAWLARARGKNVHDVQALVSGHKKGNTPDDEKDPSLVEQTVTLRLLPQIEAMLRQTRADLSDEAGHHLDDNALLDILCRRAREPATRSDKAPPPAYQVTIRRCDQCARREQLAGGRWVPIDAAALATAECDCIIENDAVGHATAECDSITGNDAAALATAECDCTIEHDSGGAHDVCCRDATDDGTGVRVASSNGMPPLPKPTKRSRRIPTKVRNFVWQRDGGRCQFPGCRATRNLDFHHLEPFADGGQHIPPNLLVVCSGHHKLNHDGVVSITGTAPDQLTFMRDGKSLVDPNAPAERAADNTVRESAAAEREAHTQAKQSSKFAGVAKLTEAKGALRHLGYTARAAKEALERAYADVGPDADVATLIKAVLAMGRAAESESAKPIRSEDLVADARRALVQSGYSSGVARSAVEAAIAHCGPDVDLASILKEAFRRCRGG